MAEAKISSVAKTELTPQLDPWHDFSGIYKRPLDADLYAQFMVLCTALRCLHVMLVLSGDVQAARKALGESKDAHIAKLVEAQTRVSELIVVAEKRGLSRDADELQAVNREISLHLAAKRQWATASIDEKIDEKKVRAPTRLICTPALRSFSLPCSCHIVEFFPVDFHG